MVDHRGFRASRRLRAYSSDRRITADFLCSSAVVIWLPGVNQRLQKEVKSQHQPIMHQLFVSCRWQRRMKSVVFLREANSTSLFSLHVGQKPYLCQVCEQAFIDAHVLECHILGMHEEEQPFFCDVYVKDFYPMKHIDRHSDVAHQAFGDSNVILNCFFISLNSH